MRSDLRLFGFSALRQGQTRTIGIRDGTDFAETVEVRRFWTYPKYNGTAYYDIAVIELGN